MGGIDQHDRLPRCGQTPGDRNKILNHGGAVFRFPHQSCQGFDYVPLSRATVAIRRMTPNRARRTPTPIQYGSRAGDQDPRSDEVPLLAIML